MVHSKRKHADEDASSKQSRSEPVDVKLVASSIYASNSGNGQSQVYDLATTINEMESASTSFVQLSSLQRLKARVLEVDKTNQNQSENDRNMSFMANALVEIIEVLSWLLSLYLLDTAKPLRKTLVGVIGVVVDNAKLTANKSEGNDNKVVECVQAIVKSYRATHITEVIKTKCSPYVFTITETGDAISTLVGIFELPYLNDLLLVSTNNIEEILAFLNLHLVSHLASVSTVTTTKTSASKRPLELVQVGDATMSLECAGYVMKALIQMLSMTQGSKWRLDAENQHVSTQAVVTSLVNHCLLLLQSGNGLVQKDQLTQTSLSLVLLLRSTVLDVNTKKSAVEKGTSDSGGSGSSFCHVISSMFQQLEESSTLSLTQDKNRNEEVAFYSTLPVQSQEIVSKIFSNTMTTLPNISKLSILRGIIHVVDDASLVDPNTTESVNKGDCLGSVVFQKVISACEDPSPPIQLYAFQVLDSFCGRLATLASTSADQTSKTSNFSSIRNSLYHLIENIVDGSIDLILRCWESPNKGLSRILPSVFSRVVDLEAQRLTTFKQSVQQQSLSSESSDSEDRVGGVWQSLLLRISSQPSKRKGKYTALCVLIPQFIKSSHDAILNNFNIISEDKTDTLLLELNAGEKAIMHLLKTLSPAVLEAVSSTTAHSVAPSATALFSQLLNSLKQLQEERREKSGLSSNASLVSNRKLKKASKKMKKAHDSSNNGIENTGVSDENNAAKLNELEMFAVKFEESSRELWMKPLISSLLHTSELVRTRSADYLLAEAIRLDPGSILPLIVSLRQHHQYLSVSPVSPTTTVGDNSTSSGGGGGCDDAVVFGRNEMSVCSSENMTLNDRLLWSIVHVVRYGRLNGLTLVDDIIVSSNHHSQWFIEVAATVPTQVEKTLEVGTLASSSSSSQPTLSLCKGLLLSEFTNALVHYDGDLRLSALEIICSSTKTKTFPTLLEISLLMKSLPVSLNCSPADQRHRIMRMVQKLLIRARESTLSSNAASPSVATSLQEVEPVSSLLTSESDTVNNRVCLFVNWLCECLMQQLYPGAPFSRELISLELLNMCFIELVDNADITYQLNHKKGKGAASQSSSSSTGTATDLIESRTLGTILEKQIFTFSCCNTFFTLLLSSWDRSRSLAKNLLSRFPVPFPGMQVLPPSPTTASSPVSTTASSPGYLLLDALTLTASARQTDAEAGAIIIHLVLQSYVIENIVSVRLNNEAAAISEKEKGELTCLTDLVYVYLNDLVLLISSKLKKLVLHFKDIHGHGSYAPALGDYRGDKTKHQPDQDANNKEGVDTEEGIELVNGLIIALKLCVESSVAVLMKNANMMKSSSFYQQGDWSKLFESCAQVLLDSLNVSMMVVGDQSDMDEEQVNPQGNNHKSESESGAQGSSGKNPELHQCFVNPCVKSKLAINSSAVPASVSSGGGGNKLKYGEDIGAAARSGNLKNEANSSDKSSSSNDYMKFQMAVVGSWLMARDSCSSLAALVKALPLPTQEDDDDNGDANSSMGNAYISVASVARIGDTLLEALQRLKHTGAIAAAQQGFQELCKVLLAPQRSAPNSHSIAPKKDDAKFHTANNAKKVSAQLRALPMKWAQATVRRLQGFDGSLYVLRRSACYGSSFISICRSDACLTNQGTPTVFPYILNHLLLLAIKSVLNGQELTLALDQLANINKISSLSNILNDQEANSAKEAVKWQVGVHALNVLRSVFLDAFIGENVFPYVSLGIKISVRGFSHPEWAIRNSSTMLFAAVIQRTVANQKNASSSGNGGSMLSPKPSCFYTIHQKDSEVVTFSDDHLEGTTASEFFHRFSDLSSFLLLEMKTACQSSDAGFETETLEDGMEEGEGTKTSVSKVAVHPSLVPLLLLLSRLRPSSEVCDRRIFLGKELLAEELQALNGSIVSSGDGAAMIIDGDNNEVTCSLDIFLKMLLKHVLQCRNQRHHTARIMAARAAAAICPLNQLCTLASQLILSLPVTSTNMNDAMTDDDDKDKDLVQESGLFHLDDCPSTTNAVHGTLLLLKEVLVILFKDHDLSKVSSSSSSSSSKNVATDSRKEKELSILFSLISSHLLKLVDNHQSFMVPPPIQLASLQILTVVGTFFKPMTLTMKKSSAFSIPFIEQFVVDVKETILRAAQSNVLASTNNEASPWNSLLKIQLTRLAVFFWFQECGNSLDTRTTATSVSRDSDDKGAVGMEILFSNSTFDGKRELNFDMLSRLLQSHDHDVKKSSIKAIKKLLVHSNYCQLLLRKAPAHYAQLLFVLEKVLKVETYPPSQRRLLICLCYLKNISNSHSAANGTNTVSLSVVGKPSGDVEVATSEDTMKSMYDTWQLLKRLHDDVPGSSLDLSAIVNEKHALNENEEVEGDEIVEDENMLPNEDTINMKKGEEEVRNEQVVDMFGDGEVPAKALELMGYQLKKLFAKTNLDIDMEKQSYDNSMSNDDDVAPSSSYSRYLNHMKESQLSEWFLRLSRASKPDVNVAMRIAVVKSIQASGLLNCDLFRQCHGSSGVINEESNMFLDTIISVWFICFSLLLDDDEDVRDLMAVVFYENSYHLKHISQEEATGGYSNSTACRSCNLVVLQHAMNILHELVHENCERNHSILSLYENKLYEMWKNAQSINIDESSLLATQTSISESLDVRKQEESDNNDLNRPIFDPEEDNMFCESVLVVQLVTKQLARLWHGRSGGETRIHSSHSSTLPNQGVIQQESSSRRLFTSLEIRHILTSFTDRLLSVELGYLRQTNKPVISLVKSSEQVSNFRELFSSLTYLVIAASDRLVETKQDEGDDYGFARFESKVNDLLSHPNSQTALHPPLLFNTLKESISHQTFSQFYFLIPEV